MQDTRLGRVEFTLDRLRPRQMLGLEICASEFGAGGRAHLRGEILTLRDRKRATSAKRLSNTLRDTEHMMFFVRHQNEIDLLQVDKAQHAIINRASPRHRLAELGLAHRCFSADTPLTATTKVRDLMVVSRRQER